MAKSSRKAAPAPKTASGGLIPLLSNVRLQSILLFLFAFVLYANTLSHGFVLDDELIITKNQYVQQGLGGIDDIFARFTLEEQTQKLVYGDRYRPLTPAVFAAVHQLAGQNPLPYHLVCVLLFAATAVLVYRTIVLLMQKNTAGMPEQTALLAAALAAWIFAAHPIHTEVVANIKSLDETAALVLSLGALYLALRAFDTGRMAYAFAAGLAFFTGLFAKENTITFLAVIPLALWLFRKPSRRQMVRITAPVLLATVVWVLIRFQVTGWTMGEKTLSLINNPFIEYKETHWVHLGLADTLATALFTLGKYVQLLLFPHPLTSDYYPRQIPIMHFNNAWVLLSALMYLAGLGYALWGLFKGKKDPVRFGILAFLASLSIVSNLFFPIGTNMAERFIFMPSWGFCLSIGALLAALAMRGGGRRSSLVFGLTGLALLLFSVKTVLRNRDWKDNKTLIFKDVEVSKNSAKIQNACGYLLTDEARIQNDPAKKRELLNSAIEHLNKALEIHPWYIEAYYMRGNAYFLGQNYEAAVLDYRAAYKLNPNHAANRTNLALSLREAAKQLSPQNGGLPRIIQYLTESNQVYSSDAETLGLLGTAHLYAGQYLEAIHYLGRWLELTPGNPAALNALAQAYEKIGDHEKAAELLKQLPPKQ